MAVWQCELRCLPVGIWQNERCPCPVCHAPTVHLSKEHKKSRVVKLDFTVLGRGRMLLRVHGLSCLRRRSEFGFFFTVVVVTRDFADLCSKPRSDQAVSYGWAALRGEAVQMFHRWLRACVLHAQCHLVLPSFLNFEKPWLDKAR